MSDIPIPTMASWQLVVSPLATVRGIQVPYVLKWIEEESGGNPCAVGYPPAKGPDGNPREMGIAQFYNPDDLTRLKLSGDDLRAYCIPGNTHSIMYRGKLVTGFSSVLSRNLTAAEMTVQAEGAIGLIDASKKEASNDLLHIGAGSQWAPSTRDFWRMVKLQHGLPGLSRSGLPAVTKYLGRPPSNWNEFRTSIMSGNVKCDNKTEAYRSEFTGIFDNAETCANAFVETSLS